MSWIETSSGIHFDLLDPQPEQVRLSDIAKALSRLARYTGHCRHDQWYSVAEHCVHVAEYLRTGYQLSRLSLLGLLHDAAEAYTGDANRVLKDQLVNYREIEDGIQKVIWTALDVRPATDLEHRLIKQGDDVFLATEAAAMLPSKGSDWNLVQAPLPDFAFAYWERVMAEKAWLGCYDRCCEGLGGG